MSQSDDPRPAMTPPARDLFAAVERGDVDRVRTLLDADPALAKAANAEQILILTRAGMLGRVELVRLLLLRGAQAEPGSPEMQAAVTTATVNNQREVVEFLLDRGEDVNRAYRRGETLLHTAARFAGSDMIEMLLRRGADPNAEDVQGLTPRVWAVRADHGESAALLFTAGAEGDVFSAAALGQVDELDELLTEDPSLVDAKVGDSTGWTPLHFAAARGQEAAVELLLEQGADADAADFNQATAMHLAASREAYHPRLLQALVDASANIGAEDKRGRTPLHWAAANDRVDTAAFLLANGADARVTDSDGNTPGAEAKAAGHARMVEFLKRHGG
jgi:ankyrin repeat protein